MFEKWRLDCNAVFDKINENCAKLNLSEMSSNEIEDLKAQHLSDIVALWTECVNKYVQMMCSMYTNWNAGKTKDGKKTFDYNFDRKKL